MDKTVIRMAELLDVPGMLEIYAPYITGTSVTFETEVPSTVQFTERVAGYQEQYPWLVCIMNGTVAGYAYASRYRERIAYQWSAECSVYIHPAFRRRRIAEALYAALFDILRLQGYRNVYAVINLPNIPSVALHERLGFSWFATYEQVGYKLGQWKNVGWWRLVLNPFTEEPAAPEPVTAIDNSVIDAVCLQRASQITPGTTV